MWERVKKFASEQVRNPVFPWFLAFVVGNLAIPQNGCQLELPRMLTLRAMADDHSFEIGRYIDWTDEWAKTPDGRYFNNRAPGPAFVGFPVFYVIDRIFVRPSEDGKVDEKGRRPWPGRALRDLTSLFVQQIPFGLLVLFGASWLLTQGVSLVAVHFFALAAFFGNTAAIFMNNYSGHALTATCVLGVLLALVMRRFFWVGFAYGFALLSDYGVAMLLPPLIASLFYLEANARRWFVPFVCGGLLPGALWIWYHVSAFGSPFLTANHFQNPMYQDVKTEGNLLGIFKPWPDPQVLGELLFGARRGLLPTQPWILLFVPIALGRLAMHYSTRTHRLVLMFSLGGLCLLLWLNSMYGGWFAGLSAGPRYLCAIFPALAFTAALFYDYLTRRRWKAALWAGLGVALAFRGLVFAVNPMAPLEPLWKYYWREIVAKETLTNWLRLGIYWALLGIAFYFVWTRRERHQRLSNVKASASQRYAKI